jgi:hypothetical protein
MTLRLAGSTSGYTEIDAPAVAGSNTLVLPTGNGSADQALVTNGSGTLSFADRGRMTLATAQATTSGTSKDFTGIPSWVKRITVMFNGVSTNGTSTPIVQLGSGSFTTSGYLGSSTNIGATINTTNCSAYTTGIGVVHAVSATSIIRGTVSIVNVSGNVWIASATIAFSDATVVSNGASNVTLSGTLDRVRITTVNGTDTFDAGSINILYEG